MEETSDSINRSGAGTFGVTGVKAVSSTMRMGLKGANVPKGANAIGTSKKGLKHIGKHTDEFKQFDSSFTIKKQVDLGKRIAGNPKNLVNESNGSKGYEAIVKIGEAKVKVRSVVNSSGNLRTVYPVKPK